MTTRRQLLKASAFGTLLLSKGLSATGQSLCGSLPVLDKSKAQQIVPNEGSSQEPRKSAADLALNPQYTVRLCSAFQFIRSANSCLFDRASEQHVQHCSPAHREVDIHTNWSFLPWHRGLLYFVERAVRRTKGNSDLRLPYWDWEIPGHSDIPAIFTRSGLDCKIRGPFHKPSQSSIDSSLKLLRATDFASFGGSKPQDKKSPAIAQGGHLAVHQGFQMGSPMSTMLTAATDPIFYAHHANIDRFWSSWIGTNPEFPREEPNRVFFFDEVEWKWQFIWFADLIDETKLGYSYASKISTTPAHA